MVTSSTSRVRLSSLTESLRRRIVGGEWKPGARVPTRREIRSDCGASMMTVQRALAALQEEGFVVSHVGRGTRVVEHPPHLYRYGLVFQHDADPAHSNFARSLEKVAAEKAEWTPRRIAVYADVGQPGYSEDYDRLENDVERRRLAGVVVWPECGRLRRMSVVGAPEVPLVRLSAGSPKGEEVGVQLSPMRFLRRSLDYLAQRGRRRVAFLWKYSRDLVGPEDLHERVRPLLQERGMQTDLLWVQGFKHTEPRWGANWMRLMMTCLRDKPDGLVIGDDNIVEPVTRGLRDAGVEVPADVEVVAHCNFPYPTPAMVPVQRVGFDVRAVLRHALDLVDAQREGTLERRVEKASVRLDGTP